MRFRGVGRDAMGGFDLEEVSCVKELSDLSDDLRALPEQIVPIRMVASCRSQGAASSVLIPVLSLRFVRNFKNY